MRKYRFLALVAALLMTAPCIAKADCALAAKISGESVVVAWRADNAISCGTLTLYRNDWPVLVLCAEGRSGYVRIPAGYTSGGGNYKVALRGGGYCASAPVPGSSGTVDMSKPETTVQPESGVKPDNGAQSSSLAQDMIAEVNRDRAANGLGLVSEDSALTKAACVRAREIVEKFSHTRPDGTSWSTVYSGAYAENIARGYDTAYKCEAAFMSSDGHRANILRAQYTKIGVCAYTVGGVTYWVQHFGR